MNPVVNHTGELVPKVARTISENGMLLPGNSVLTAVSGGADSVALLHVLLALSDKYSLRIGVAHVNHGLRGKAADQDAAFVRDLAKKWNVPYYGKQIDVAAFRRRWGGSLEEAGRDARYSFFHEIAVGYEFDRIAVAHHMNDDAELILMNMLRGSGPTGMAGIAPVRGRVIRPLIHCRRREILNYLTARNIAYVHDKSNDDTRFHRNHIRHCLIPALEQYNPRVVENLHRLGKITAFESQWLDDRVSPVFDAAVAKRSAGRLVMAVEKINGLHAAVKRRLIRKAILAVKGNLRRIGLAHIDAVIDLIEKGRPPGRLDLPDRIRVARGNNALIFTKEKQPLRSPGLAGGLVSAPDYAYRVTEQQAVSGAIDVPEAGARLVLTRLPVEDMEGFPSGDTAAFDWEKLVFPLKIRNLRPGDRFMPLGMSGTQKLKDFFINNKIPAGQRGRVPLVQSGEQVAWVAGMRMDERFKVTRRTKTVLQAKLIRIDSWPKVNPNACGGSQT